MAIDIIFRVPLRNCRIGKWVKTSYMEGLDKELVVVSESWENWLLYLMMVSALRTMETNSAIMADHFPLP